MKITLLGTRGEIKESAPYHAKKSGVLIDGKLLFDLGEKSFLALRPKAIFITHLHPDHAFFVRGHETPKIAVPLYAPERYKETPITVPKKSFKCGRYKITPIPTVHSAKVKSTAYLIEHNKKKILYTGDLIWIEKKYHRLLKNLDTVITEASFIRKGGLIRRETATKKIYGHTGVPNLLTFFKQFTDTIILTHFGSWFYADMPKAQKKLHHLAHLNGVGVIIGHDGLELKI